MKPPKPQKRKSAASLFFCTITLLLLFFAVSCNLKKGQTKQPSFPQPAFESPDFVAVGGLFFQAEDFDSTTTKISATGKVMVGFKTSKDNIASLLQLEEGINISLGTDPTFTTQGAIDAIISGQAIPLFSGENISIDINQVLQQGVQIAEGKKIEIEGLGFTLDTLVLANAAGTPEVKLHGEMSVPALDSLKIAVEGDNFVVIDSSGINLTGLEVSLQTKDSFELGQVKFIPGAMTFQYQETGDLFEITGSGTIIADSDTINIELGNAKIAGLIISNGSIADFNFTATQDKTFNLKGLEFDPEVLNFNYQASNSIYAMYGSVKAIVESDTINVNAGDSTNAGLFIENGMIDTIDFTITQGDTFSLKTLKIDPQSLTFKYSKNPANSEDQTYLIAGAMYIQAGADTLEVNMKELAITNGEIDTLNISFNASVTLADLKLTTHDLALFYSEDSSKYMITGGVSISELFNASATFPGQGIEVVDGKWELKDFQISLSDVQLDVFEINELLVAFADTLDAYNLDVTLALSFPGGFAADGSIDFVDGKLNKLYAAISGTPIPVADTGLSIYEMSAGVNNLTSPRNLYVDGGIGLTLGDAEEDSKLFNVAAQFGVDRNSLQLEGEATFGFEAEGTVDIDLNWLNGIYTVSADWTLFEIFELILDFTINSQLFITMFGEIELFIPEEVPIIGGDQLAEAGFYFQRHLKIPVDQTNDFVAGWAEILWTEVGVKVPFADPSDYSLIGSQQINGIENSAQQAAQVFTYNSKVTVPQGATHVLLHGTWPTSLSAPNVQILLPGNSTPIDSSDFSIDNGIYIDEIHSSDQSITILIRNPPPDTMKYDTIPSGQYQLNLITETTLPGDTLAMHSRYFIPKPSLSIDSVRVITADTLAVVYYTPMATALGSDIEISFFTDYDSLDYNGSFVVETSYEPATFFASNTLSDSIIISTAHLTPFPYFLYGIIRDQVSIPDTSNYTPSITPSFSLSGNVFDTTGRVFSGIPLKLIQLGQTDTMTTLTTTAGTYEFSPLQPGTYQVSVVIPEGYAALGNQSSFNIVIQANNIQGKDFTLEELATISGTVFLDKNANGLQDSSDISLPHQRVYLTSSKGDQDTLVTNSDGNYTFYTVPKGNNEVGIVLEDFWYQTLPNDTAKYTVNILRDTFSATQATGYNFGLQKEILISGQVFYDYNGNGIFEPGDSAIAGYDVKLLGENDIENDTMTNAEGMFFFSEKAIQDTFEIQLFPQPTTEEVTSTATQVTFAMKPGPTTTLANYTIPAGYNLSDLDNDYQIDHLTAVQQSNLGIPLVAYPIEVLQNPADTSTRLATIPNNSQISFSPPFDMNNDGYNDMIFFTAFSNGAQSSENNIAVSLSNADSVGPASLIPFPVDTLNVVTLGFPIQQDTTAPPDVFFYNFLGPPAFTETSTIPYLLLNNGNNFDSASLQALPLVPSGQSILAVAAGDLWNNGLNDLAFILNTGDLMLLQNNGARSFNLTNPILALNDVSSFQAPYPAINLTDINLDGKQDILIAMDQVYYLLNNGNGNFDSIQSIPNSAMQQAVFAPSFNILATADMDLNGWPDIVVQSDTSTFIALLNQGEGLTFQAQPFSTPNRVFGLDIGDIDSDKLPDLVTSTCCPQPLTYVTMMNATSFTPFYELAVTVGDTFPNTNFGLLINDPSPPLPPSTDTMSLNPTQWDQDTPQGPRWVSGNRVRYAISFYDEDGESSIGPWMEWQEIGKFAFPEIIGILTGPSGTRGRKIYRQFWLANQVEHADAVEIIGAIPDNTTTTYQDITE